MSKPPAPNKSTLAVDRFRAATRPLGAPLAGTSAPREAGAVKGMARGDQPPARPLVGRIPQAARADARRPRLRPEMAAFDPPTAPVAAAPSVVVPSTARERRDHLIVTSVVVIFIIIALAVGSVKLSDNMRLDRSRTALGGTLAAVHQRQTEFRILNQRFATWPELAARGMELPKRQRVVKSNATASHWYLSLRDRETGVICSRTGELFDDSPLERMPTCLPGTP